MSETTSPSPPPIHLMDPAIFVGLGAGAFVVAIAIGTVLFHRKAIAALEHAGLASTSKALEVDVEKAPAHNILERREFETEWKEYTAREEKSPRFVPEMMAPLVVSFRRESDVTEARSLRPPPPIPTALPTPPRQLPLPSVPLRPVSPLAIPLLEGDISDTREWVHAPAFPPGLDVAVAKPQAAVLKPPGVGARVLPWPVLIPAPVEEAGIPPEQPVILADSPILERPFACDITATITTTKSPSITGSPTGSLQCLIAFGVEEASEGSECSSIHSRDALSSPASYSPSICSGDMSPLYSHSYALLSSGNSSPILGPTASPVQAELYFDVAPSGSISVGVPAAIALPDSLPPSPTVTEALIPMYDQLPVAIIYPRATYEPEHEIALDVSDHTSSIPLHIDTSPMINQPRTVESDDTDLATSPLLSISSASSYSSGPETPSEPKQESLFDPALASPRKCSRTVSIVDDDDSREAHGDINEASDILASADKVASDRQAPDPPLPEMGPEPISPPCTLLSLPGSFEKKDLLLVEPVSAQPVPVEIPFWTADMLQLCHAFLAVSNCAGLVAQFVVGFSVWWGFALVSA